jgi:hypothetical protein
MKLPPVLATAELPMVSDLTPNAYVGGLRRGL